MLTQADVDEFLHLAATTQVDTDHLAVLETAAEVVAFGIAIARQHGSDEADRAELLVRANGMSPDDVRCLERTLRRLNYRLVADRLREISGRRKHSLKPLQ